jgi:hypothetical protein
LTGSEDTVLPLDLFACEHAVPAVEHAKHEEPQAVTAQTRRARP